MNMKRTTKTAQTKTSQMYRPSSSIVPGTRGEREALSRGSSRSSSGASRPRSASRGSRLRRRRASPSSGVPAPALSLHNDVVGPYFKDLSNDEQKQRWLPEMAALRKLGAFALTEPDHGSDSVALETTARRDGSAYVIDGAKRWIGLGHVADLVIIWARDTADAKVKAFVLEKGADGQYPEGYSAEAITGKIAKRAIQQAHIEISGLRIPAGNKLAKSTSFRDVSAILNRTRSAVAWEALGHALAAYEAAAVYVQERVQFGKPIASFQLVQNKLANMLADLTAMQLLCFRTATLQDEGRLTNEQASLAKMFTGQHARALCRDARDLLGGNGLLLENHVARHLTDMEVVHTYEGTDFIQSLIIGRQITGISAFA